jgi:WD40 repeat protein
MHAESNYGMRKCLNPSGVHLFAESHAGELFCPTAHCGFLREGARIGRWRAVQFLQRNAISDLYVAITAGEERERTQNAYFLLRIVHQVVPGTQQALHLLPRLHHPHIHPLLLCEWLEPPGIGCLLSRYEAGGSLAAFLKGSVNLPLPLLATMIRQAGEALSFAHQQGIIHGRLKAENCLLAAPGSLQVCDFYYTQLAGVTRSSSAIFYPVTEYQEGQLTPAADQFALALLIRQLLNRYLASSSQPSPDERAVRHTGEYLPLFPFTNPVDQVLSKALNPLPSMRFADVQTFVHTFLTALDSLTSYLSRQALPPDPRREAIPRLSQPRERSSPLPTSETPQILSGHGSELLSSPGPEERNHPSHPGDANAHLPKGATVLRHLPGHTSMITALSLTADGRYLVSGDADGTLRLWLLQGRIGALQQTLEGHERKILASGWSPDGHHFASASSDASIRLWRVQASKPAQLHSLGALYGHHSDVCALSWSPDGRYLASGGKDHMVHIWDTNRQDLRHWRLSGRSGVKTLSWSPDPSILAVGSDQQISLWDLNTWSLLKQWDAQKDEVRQIVWSPDGKYLASIGGKKDLRICLWNPNNGNLLGELIGHSREVCMLCWPADACWLASVATDCTLRFWQVQPLPAQQIGNPISLESVPQTAAGSNSGLFAVGLDTLTILTLQSQ